MILNVESTDIFEVNGNALSSERRIEEILKTVDFNNGDSINLDGVLCGTEEEFRRKKKKKMDN